MEKIMLILSYVLSVVSLGLMITASLLKGKRMKQILFLVFCANFLLGTAYFLNGKGINGAAACYLGAAQAIINYFFDSRDKSIPKWLIAIYALSIIVLNIWVAGGITLLGILVIVASLCYVLSINQKNGAQYRICTLITMLLWCIYDVLSGSYNALITHSPQLIFIIAGMFIHDRDKQKNGQ